MTTGGIMLRIILVVSALFGPLAACANVQPVKQGFFGKTLEKTEPEIGTVAESTLGESLITQSTVHIVPAIKLLSAYRTEWMRNSGHRAFPFVFSENTILLKIAIHQDVPIYSGPSTGGLIGTDGSQFGTPYGVGITDDGRVRFVMVANSIIPETDGRTVSFELISAIQKTDKNFRQEFIYSGRTGDSIFFTYREFSGDLIRPAFTQNVTYSLSNKNIVAFKRLRLKILSADNTKIRYRILKVF
jgi:hypothetical protein